MSRSQTYVRELLTLYLGLPHTAARKASTHDRRIAGQLLQQGVPLETVEAAFLLATARRLIRTDPDLPPLPPIRSLAYFLPVLEEILLDPLDPGYIEYLRRKAIS